MQTEANPSANISSSNNRFVQFFKDMGNNMSEVCSGVQSEIVQDANMKFSAMLRDNEDVLSAVSGEIIALANSTDVGSVATSEAAIEDQLNTYLGSPDHERLKTVIGLVRDLNQNLSLNVSGPTFTNQEQLNKLQSTYRNMYAVSCGKIALCKLGLGILKVTSPVYVALKNSLLTLLSAAKLIASTIAALLSGIALVIALKTDSLISSGFTDKAVTVVGDATINSITSMCNSFDNIRDIVTLKSNTAEEHRDASLVSTSMVEAAGEQGAEDSVMARIGIKVVDVARHDYVGELVRDFASAVSTANTGFESVSDLAKDGLHAAHSMFHKADPSVEVTAPAVLDASNSVGIPDGSNRK